MFGVWCLVNFSVGISVWDGLGCVWCGIGVSCIGLILLELCITVAWFAVTFWLNSFLVMDNRFQFPVSCYHLNQVQRSIRYP